nr:capsid cement protein [Azospirillum endophyticum]
MLVAGFALAATARAAAAGAAQDKALRPSPDPPARPGPALSIRDRGAVGDGRSHPLSERYKNLESARRVHPHVRSLDQECDWAALQGAVLELSRTGQGGTVLVPPGHYRLDGEIVLPNLDRYDDAFNEVEIVGAGMRASLLSWPEDPGPGRFAIRAGSRQAGRDDNDGYQRSRIAHLSLRGPKPGNRPGEPPPGMGGIALTSRFLLERVGVYGFRTGVDVWRDHSSLISCQLTKNHIGAYWSAGTDSFGDHLFLDTDLAGNTLASIAVAPENGIDHSSFISCHFGFSPYAILAEDGPQKRTFLSNNKFLDCAFEACGNGWIQGPMAEMYGNVLIGCSGSLLPDYRLPKRPVTGLLVVRSLERNQFTGGSASFGDGTNDRAADLETAAIVAGSAVGNRFDDAERLIRLGRDGLAPALAISGTCRANRFEALDCSGEFRKAGAGGVDAGNLVQRDYDRVRRLEPDRPADGVALTSAPAGGIVPVATAGTVPVGKTRPAIRMGTVLRPGSGTSQRVDPSAGPGAPVGVAVTDAPAGSDSVLMDLRLELR